MLKEKSGRSALASRRETPEINARAQIKEYKESLILDAAASLFYEKGFQRTTIDDIGGVLGVTKPFIYTYFESKHHILEKLFDRVYLEVYQGATAPDGHDASDPVAHFKHFVSWYLRVNLQRQQFSAILLEEEKNLSAKKLSEIRKMQRQFDDVLAKLIEDGVHAGVFNTTEPKLASLAISGIVRWTHRWYSPKGRLPMDELVEHIAEMALRIVGWSGKPAAKSMQVTAKRKKPSAKA